MTLGDGPWDASSPQPAQVRNQIAPISANQNQRKRLHFDPKLLPKFTTGGDLEQWIMEIQLNIDTYSKEIVCLIIWHYCFEEQSSVRTWYMLLGGRVQAFMTMDAGCWINFMHKMREIWSKPIAVAQEEVVDRLNLPGESYHQFYFAKLKLLTSAFVESLAATHIS